MVDGVAEAAERLGRDRGLLEHSSTAERTAAILRRHITQGLFKPDARLAEDVIGNALGVSRNTLREAFRLLSHERLLVHKLNRGVFVRALTAADVRDLYRIRRLVECAAVGDASPPAEEGLAGLREAVGAAEKAAEEERWGDVGTANMEFHQAVVDLMGSPRTTELMSQVLAELRLGFLVVTDPRAFHGRYLPRNRRILGLIEAGDVEGARAALTDYLDDAEATLLKAYA
ncbi:GntR family transcriptional regulator [Sphaerisporangium aureirubrum]|uniref:GntR family transcriptional regulator n=1 Tax=Sphaerisporangium aureirubrum TaxID=1544736 RepID=A0ABW1NCX5_9ACTN